MDGLTPLNTSFIVDDFSTIYDLLNSSDYNDGNNSFELDHRTLTCETATLSPGINITICMFYSLVILLAIPGNLVVGLVICRSNRPLLPFDLYLLNLAVADALLALTLPFWAVASVSGWIFGDAMCKLVSLVQEATFYSSILLLACISVDRYRIIVHAVKARKKHRQAHSSAACVAVWTLGGALSLPALFSNSFRLQGSEWAVCTEYYDPETDAQWRLATRILRHGLGFLLPLVVMLSCYGVTVARLLRTQGFQKQRAMRMIVAVVAAFLFCWMPYHLALMVDTLLRVGVVPYGCWARTSVYTALFSTQSLGLLHCCINPVLYAFVGDKFQRKLRTLRQTQRVPERTVPPSVSRPASQSSDVTSTIM